MTEWPNEATAMAYLLASRFAAFPDHVDMEVPR